MKLLLKPPGQLCAGASGLARQAEWCIERPATTEVQMPRISLPIALVIAAGLAAPATGAPKPNESWGKADVSLEQYRQDAVDCASIAYYADVSETEQAAAFVRGTKRLESIDGLPLDFFDLARRYGQIEASVRPERQIRELRQAMQSVVDICLTRRGYVKFRLTEEQRDQLGHLRKGSLERRRYLHMLASDPQVLRAQHIAQG
jgi:hypothetical protein